MPEGSCKYDECERPCWCKGTCKFHYQQEWRSANAERLRVEQAAYYVENREKIKARSIAWSRANPERKSERDAQWRAANPERVRERLAAHYLANKEKHRANDARWRAANPGKQAEASARWRAAHPETMKAYSEAWRAANPEKARSAVRRRRARKRNAYSEPYVDLDIYERDGWICQLCGEPVDRWRKSPDRWSVSIDHAIPLALGGDDTPANVQTAHRSCNSRKWIKVPEAS